MSEFVEHLRCPDDAAGLQEGRDALVCSECGRNYPRIGDRIFEILPSSPAELPAETANTRYAAKYHTFFHEQPDPAKDAIAWGAPDVVGERWERVRRRHVAEVLAFLCKGNPSSAKSFCDFSAGAGYCTFEAAKDHRAVFHCDLAADSLLYGSRKATMLGRDNIIFIRADYFAPPFRGSVDHIVCLDTLIRGEWHEQRLLRSVQNALLPGGTAVVDFHNWWHNPLRRIGLLPENFAENRSYAAAELPGLLAAAGIDDFELQPFIQELSADAWGAHLLKRVIPPTRFLVRLTGGAVQDSAESFARAAST